MQPHGSDLRFSLAQLSDFFPENPEKTEFFDFYAHFEPRLAAPWQHFGPGTLTYSDSA